MRRRTRDDRGSVALVLVLISVAMMTGLVVEILYRAKVAETVVTNRRDNEKAYELARAAVRWSVFRLQLDQILDQIPAIPNTNYGGKKDDLTEVQWAIPLPYPLPAALLGAVTEGETTALEEERLKSMAAAAEDLGGSFVSAIADEAARINLNDVGSGGFGSQIRWSGAAEVLENLLLQPRFTPYFKGRDHRALLWAIDDWIDVDSEVNHLGGGIEDAEYQTEDREAHVKNGPFYSVEEVRRLKPMTDELYRELRPFVTVYPFDARLPKVAQSMVVPRGMINVNTAPLELIAAAFSRQAMPEQRRRLECAQAIVKFRQNVAFRSVQGAEPSFLGAAQQLCQVSGTGEGGGPRAVNFAVQQILSVRSDTFAVEATGIANDFTRTIRTVVYRADPTKPRLLYWKVI